MEAHVNVRLLAAIAAVLVAGGVVVKLVTRDGSDSRPASTSESRTDGLPGAADQRVRPGGSALQPGISSASAAGSSAMSGAPTLPVAASDAPPSGPPRPRADLAFAAIGRTKTVPLEPELRDVAETAIRERAAGNHKASRAAADAVLARHHNHPNMLRVAAEAACAMGDAKGAQAYFDRASSSTRTAISFACQASNIKLSSPPPKPLNPARPTKP